mmetsp:Transcript_26298/g.44020  ORF Transcript_26298/g.44020 Transcript_26298/m.44020 type:complete len:485 (-) Transcript_26298:129-1583(-)|eukprot:CAMPEP_0198212662 /NCGR_PEP_ID=MMETSP1445-20131203/27077_1 /TAXON_ID=36898 /ORGANISM="Pyramimonas sp., Strain CCMP2087" /LENGTH=484 /DNA_ID=CAMNT_0043887167 /DNA_START=243 /DNA_END=1697 /DNA_ORIENTATION=+
MWCRQRSLARAVLQGVRQQLRKGSSFGPTSSGAEGLIGRIHNQPPWEGLGINQTWSRSFRSTSNQLLARSKVVDVDVYELSDDDDSELVWPPPDGFLDMVDPELAKEILASEEAELALARLASKMKGASKSRTSTQTAEKEVRRPNIDDMSYKKLVLKLRRFLAEIFKDSDGNKDPNITKSVVKRLKSIQMKELLTDADQPTDGMKAELALRLWEYLQPIESVHRNKVRTMRKKFPGNYPMGLRHGSRGAELEGGLDPINQLNKITDEEEQQAEDERRRLAALTSTGGRTQSAQAKARKQMADTDAKPRGRGRPATKDQTDDESGGEEEFSMMDVEARSYPMAVSPEEVASLLQKAKINSILVLHLDKSLSHFTNAFVIGTGRSPRHLYAAANAVAYLVKQRFAEANYKQGSCSIQGQPDSTWVAVDAGSVVIHLFDEDTREHYNLEELWEPRAERVVWIPDVDTLSTEQPVPVSKTNPLNLAP